LQSKKLKEKEELQKKRKIVNEIKNRQEMLRKEREREERERLYMEGNDFNVVSEHFESEDD
jgi:nitric oxide reductase activation protein